MSLIPPPNREGNEDARGGLADDGEHGLVAQGRVAEGGDVEQAELISAGVIVSRAARATGLPRLRTAPAVVAWTVVVEDGGEEAGAFSRTSYWSPLVTTKSPSSFARTSMHAIMRFVNPSRGLGGRGDARRGVCRGELGVGLLHPRLDEA